jgi:hypothetical protein
MEGGPINLPGIPGSESVPAIPGSDVSSGVPGPQPESRGRRLWLWLELLIAAGVTVLLGLAGLGFLLNAVGAHQHHGGSRAGQAIAAAISFGLVVLSTRWAIRVEHRLRRRQPVAEAFAIAAAAPAPAREVRSSPLRVRPRRHYGPVATGITLALFAGATIGFAVGSISSHSQGCAPPLCNTTEPEPARSSNLSITPSTARGAAVTTPPQSRSPYLRPWTARERPSFTTQGSPISQPARP